MFAGVCRADRPVWHPLTPAEARELTADLAADGVPVTVQLDGDADPADPAGRPVVVVLFTAVALTTWQQVHAVALVQARTDAPVRWAGA